MDKSLKRIVTPIAMAFGLILWMYLGLVPPVEKRVKYANDIKFQLDKKGFENINILSNVTYLENPYTWFKKVPKLVSGDILLSKISRNKTDPITTKLSFVQIVPSLHESFYPSKANITIYSGSCISETFRYLNEQNFSQMIEDGHKVTIFGNKLPKKFSELIRNPDLIMETLLTIMGEENIGFYKKNELIFIFEKAKKIICNK